MAKNKKKRHGSKVWKAVTKEAKDAIKELQKVLHEPQKQTA